MEVWICAKVEENQTKNNLGVEFRIKTVLSMSFLKKQLLNCLIFMLNKISVIRLGDDDPGAHPGYN